MVHTHIKAESHIPCRAHAVPLSFCAAKGLDCVFPVWFTQCGRVWVTLAMPMPMPCSDHAVLLIATAQHVRQQKAYGLPARVRLLPATTRSSTKIIRSILFLLTTIHTYYHRRSVAALYKKDDLLNCWTNSSDISGYHAEFHEGHGTIGARQGRGVECVN